MFASANSSATTLSRETLIESLRFNILALGLYSTTENLSNNDPEIKNTIASDILALVDHLNLYLSNLNSFTDLNNSELTNSVTTHLSNMVSNDSGYQEELIAAILSTCDAFNQLLEMFKATQSTAITVQTYATKSPASSSETPLLIGEAKQQVITNKIQEQLAVLEAYAGYAIIGKAIDDTQSFLIALSNNKEENLLPQLRTSISALLNEGTPAITATARELLICLAMLLPANSLEEGQPVDIYDQEPIDLELDPQQRKFIAGPQGTLCNLETLIGWNLFSAVVATDKVTLEKSQSTTEITACDFNYYVPNKKEPETKTKLIQKKLMQYENVAFNYWDARYILEMAREQRLPGLKSFILPEKPELKPQRTPKSRPKPVEPKNPTTASGLTKETPTALTTAVMSGTLAERKFSENILTAGFFGNGTEAKTSRQRVIQQLSNTYDGKCGIFSRRRGTLYKKYKNTSGEEILDDLRKHAKKSNGSSRKTLLAHGFSVHSR